MEKVEKKKMPWWKKTLVISGSTIGGLIAFLLVFILVLNVGKFGIYHSYYSIRELVCTNYGINENYCSQGTAITNDGKYVLTSGYMSDKTNSRVYLTDVETDTTKYVKFVKDGKLNKYHFGGLAVSNDNVFVVSNDSIFTVSLTDIINAENGSEIELGKGAPVHNQASFVFTDDEYLYVGEFYNGNEYKTDNSITYNGKTYNAIVEKYFVDDLTNVLAVYAIRDKVQGFAVSPSGGMLLSTSWGLDSSHLYYYKSSTIVDTNETYLDAPLYVLEEPTLDIKAPAMTEDLDYLDGKFYTNFETACNKYIFGKFFISSNKIVALDVESLL